MKRSLLLLATAAVGFGQAGAQRLEFEVASVRAAGPLDKMVASGKMHIGMHIDGARVDIGSMSVPEMIQIAYKVKRYQVSGAGADGITAQRYDIMAKIPEGATKDQVPEMLQALLEDRFKLKFHRETKDLPVFALVVAKGGPKLKESPPDEPVAADDPNAGTPSNQVKVNVQGEKGAVITGGQNGTTKVAMGPNGAMHFEMQKMQINALAEFLARFVERPVIDMTGLKGNYQVGLDLSMDDLRTVARSAGVAIPAGGPPEAGKGPADGASDPTSSIFSTVQQLGLKLEPRKAPIEILIIDHVEKTPTDN